jgi:hypothetical protein
MQMNMNMVYFYKCPLPMFRMSSYLIASVLSRERLMQMNMNMVYSYKSPLPMFRMSSYVRSRPGVLPYQGLKVGYCTDIKENMYKCSPPLQINPLSASPSDQAAQPLSQCSHKKLHSASSFPLLMMEPEVDKDNNHLIRFADFPDNRVWTTKGMVPKEVNDAICIGSSHGWLAYISRRDCSIFLWNPFITITSPDPPRLIRLPPIDTLPHVTVVPLGESGISRKSDDWHCTSTTSNILRSAYEDEFSADFNFKVEYQDTVLGLKGRGDYIISPNELSIYFIRKIVLSSAPTSDDCVVVALPHRQHNPSIAFCKPGDKSWTFVEPVKEFSRIEDVIHFQDHLFYTVSSGGTPIVAYDLADLSSPKSYFLEASFNFQPLSSTCQSITSWSVAKHYLVESLGNLLWVRRFVSSHMDDMANMLYDEEVEFPRRTTGFDVYRLDFARNTWEFTN